MRNAYEDLMHLPHHVSKKHPQMSQLERAAQFSPFAALTGYEDAIEETARVTEKCVQLSETAQEELDRKFADVREHVKDMPAVQIKYFVPDETKEGGAYVTITGRVQKVDELERKIWLCDGKDIDIEQIVAFE